MNVYESVSHPRLLRRGLLVGNCLLLAHGGQNRDGEVLAIVEHGLDLLAEVTFGDLDVVLGRAIGGHHVEKPVINVNELVLVTVHVRDVHVVRGRANVLHLLRREDLKLESGRLAL
jgi:hypothetical protein